MKIIRYKHGKLPASYGWIDEGMVGGLSGSPFGPFRRLKAQTPLSSIILLAPVTPEKIIAVGRNYVEHAKEQDADVPDTPIIFLKPTTTVIGPGENILLPPQSSRIDYEGELAVVIGKSGRWIDIEKVDEYIFGYTIGNDITARDLQKLDGQWTRAKGFDTFCPIGPWIETNLDVSDLLIRTRLNGEIRQMASTREMVFNIPQLVVYISSIMTLKPGDVILSGTPAGIGELSEKDEVSVSIEGIGELTNQVALDQRHI